MIIPVQSKTSYDIYSKPEDIEYTPENALKNGLGMVNTMEAALEKLELGSELRKEVWLREIERYAFTYRVSALRRLRKLYAASLVPSAAYTSVWTLRLCAEWAIARGVWQCCTTSDTSQYVRCTVHHNCRTWS